MKQLLPINNLYALSMPIDAQEFKINERGWLCYKKNDSVEWHPFIEPFMLYNDFNIVGRCTQGFVDFTPSQYIPSYCKLYMDYTSELNGLAAHSLDDISSFYTLLIKNEFDLSIAPFNILILKQKI